MDAWCATHLGAAVASARGWITSVGCVGLVVLADGREAAIKVHQPDRSTAFLVDVQTVQRTVVEAGVAAPLPLVPPAPIRPGGPLATADSFVADPGLTDGRAPVRRGRRRSPSPSRRRATRHLPSTTIAAHPMHTPAGQLYPTPHSPVFDFEATADGAEWIDDHARAAREVLDVPGVGGPPVLIHQDWCSRNVRVVDGVVVAAYDWDSVSRVPVARAAGHAAILWPCTGEPGMPDPSTAEELDAFLDAFADGWGPAHGRRPARRPRVGPVLARLPGPVRARHRPEGRAGYPVPAGVAVERPHDRRDDPRRAAPGVVAG